MYLPVKQTPRQIYGNCCDNHLFEANNAITPGSSASHCFANVFFIFATPDFEIKKYECGQFPVVNHDHLSQTAFQVISEYNNKQQVIDSIFCPSVNIGCS